MRNICFSLSLVAFFITPTSAISGELRACGVPDHVEIPTETEGYCDIHQRRFAYREKAIKLKEQMQARAENFAAPRRQALEQYEKDVQALNEIRTSEEADPNENEELAKVDSKSGTSPNDSE